MVDKSFPIYKQEHKYSCGIACIRMLLSYFGENFSEGDIKKKTFTTFWLGGTPSFSVVWSANRLLKKHHYKITMRVGLTIETIMSYLDLGFPLMHVYMSPRGDNPHMKVKKQGYSAHYVFLLSIDQEAQTVDILNPYGYVQTLPFALWWDRVSFSRPYVSQKRIKLVRMLSLLRPRTFFVLQPTP